MSHPDIIELLVRLEAEHEEGRHLYRGQLKRYPPHCWTAHGEERQVEALYPADYRFHYAHHDFAPHEQERMARRISAARAYGRNVRDQFTVFLLALLQTKGHEDARAWASARFPELEAAIANGTAPHNAHFFRMAWSLAQHYFLTTALTDLTFSARVAAWFATEPWKVDGARPASGEHGVIYRIDRPRLESILRRATELSHAMSETEGSAPAPEFFVVDIREIPTWLARRPAAQQGASLYGFDQAHILAAPSEIARRR